MGHNGAILAAALTGIVLFLFGASTDAFPHEALKGWNYPFACCANYDCKEVSQSDIGESPEGYVIKGTGEVIPYTDKRRKDSPDGEYHWCAHQAGLDAGKTICLFVPPPSY